MLEFKVLMQAKENEPIAIGDLNTKTITKFRKINTFKNKYFHHPECKQFIYDYGIRKEAFDTDWKLWRLNTTTEKMVPRLRSTIEYRTCLGIYTNVRLFDHCFLLSGKKRYFISQPYIPASYCFPEYEEKIMIPLEEHCKTIGLQLEYSLERSFHCPHYTVLLIFTLIDTGTFMRYQSNFLRYQNEMVAEAIYNAQKGVRL